MITVGLLISLIVLQSCAANPLKPQYVVSLQYGKDDHRKAHSVSAKEGSTFQISCQLDSKWPKGTKVEWAKDGGVLKKSSNMKILTHNTICFDKYDEDAHGGVYECLARAKNVRSTQRIIVRKDGSSEIQLPPNVQFCAKKGYCLNNGVCLEDASKQQFCICMNAYNGERCQVPPLSKVEDPPNIKFQEAPESAGLLTWRDVLILILILTVFGLILCISLSGMHLFWRKLSVPPVNYSLPLYSAPTFCLRCGSDIADFGRQYRVRCVHCSDGHQPCCCDVKSHCPPLSPGHVGSEVKSAEQKNSSIPASCARRWENDADSSSCGDTHGVTRQSSYEDCQQIVENEKKTADDELSQLINEKRPSRSRLVTQPNIDQDIEMCGARLAPGLPHLASADCNYFSTVT